VRIAVTTALAVTSLGIALLASAAGPPPREIEYAVKAAFLYQFARFVEWPDSSAAASGPVRICVVGQDPFGEALDLATQDKRAAGRPLQVRRFRGLQDLKPCSIVFVAGADTVAASAVALQLRGSASLVVGEAPGFTQNGGMIAFRVDGGVVRFDINESAATTEGISVSGRLLGLAATLGLAKAGP
jgi:hypothetical protein